MGVRTPSGHILFYSKFGVHYRCWARIGQLPIFLNILHSKKLRNPNPRGPNGLTLTVTSPMQGA